MLSEPNVKVVFHQTAVHVTPLSAWIIYPKGSALAHSTRCLAPAWLSEVDSLFCSRCRTCCSGGGRSSYVDPFPYGQRFPGSSQNSLIAPGRAKPSFLVRLLSPRPSSFSMKNKSTSRSPKAFSLPSPSPRRAFPLVVVWEAFHYLNVGRHSLIPLF